MGVALEGSSSAWPGGAAPAALPTFDVYSQRRHFIDVFNRGRASFRIHRLGERALDRTQHYARLR